jgi:iron complex outermembrane recepter protein
MPLIRKDRDMKFLGSSRTVMLIAACAQIAFGQKAADTKKDYTNTMDSATLDRIVVTATKTSQKLSKAPAAISVVTKEDMARHSYSGIDEALKYESGVYNKRSKGLAETMAGTVMRGFAGADQILVLLDGQPMNNGYEGRAQFNHVQMDDIDKIEVVRGPFSSLYGGNAMGGVVSLITKKPYKKEFGSRSYYGSDGSYGLSSSYADYIANRLGFRISVGDKYSGGYASDDVVKTLGTKGSKGKNVTGVDETLNQTGVRSILLGNLGNNGAENKSINAKLYYDINGDHSISLGVRNSWYKYWRDYGTSNVRDSLGNTVDTGYITYRLSDTTYYMKLTQSNFLGGSGGQDATFYTLGYDGKVSDKLKLKFRSGFTHQYNSWYTSVLTASTRGDGAGKLSSSPNMKGDAELTAEMKDMLPLQTLLAGISVEGAKADIEEWTLSKWYDEESKVTQTYMATGKSGSGALFLQDEISILKDKSIFKSLSAFAGARADYWKTFDGANRDFTNVKINNKYDSHEKLSLSPKLAVVSSHGTGDIWTPSFRIAGGKAFRAPTIYTLYRTWLSGTRVYEGNPELKPEETWSIEGGMNNYFWKKRVQLSLTGYYNRISNMIYTSTISDTVSRSVNAGKAKTKGIETGLRFAPVSMWNIYCNYTWTDSRIVENTTNPLSEGKRTTGVPEHVCQVGSSINWKAIFLCVDGRYVSKRYSNDLNNDVVNGVYGSRDPVTTWDAALGYSINKSLTLTVKVDNFTDIHVYDYYRMPGRVWTGEAKVDF